MLATKPVSSNAGKAFIDFFLGSESMKIMAQHGEFVTPKGIRLPILGAEKIKFIENDVLRSKWARRKEKRISENIMQQLRSA